ncbi:OmpA/MotB family protein [Rubrivirga sp.]|uniref:OmpA/MotB family protein n=1 Tax=Rubrivirga sp. TaxID=1885344 RepID=UPI003C71DCC1
MARTRPAFAEEEEPSAPFWMATFSDMMTLLLAFFVMIVAMSSVEVKRFEEALSYFTGRDGILDSEGLTVGVVKLTADEREQADLFQELAQDIRSMGLEDAVDVDLTAKGIRVTFVDSIAFASGSVALDSAAEGLLERVAGLAVSSRAIVVEGHTDDVPISTTHYPSNWELSAARAASVVRYLSTESDSVSSARYVATGYGEFRPRATNGTAEGRARNRRISILFQTSEPNEDSIVPQLPFQTHVE